MADEWYYAKGDEKHGPVTTAQLKELAAKGDLAPDDLIWCQGKSPDWVPAKSAKGLFATTSPPPLPGEKPTGPPPLPANADPAEAERAGRRRRPKVRGAGQRRSRNRVAILPAWAKWMIAAIASVACLVILVWLFRGATPAASQPSITPGWHTSSGTATGRVPQAPPVGPSSVPARAPTTPQLPRTRAQPAPPLPAAAIDRRLLVGTWLSRKPSGAGFGLMMALRSDGSFTSEMWKFDIAGAFAGKAEIAGPWHVSGKNLYLLQPDGSPVFTALIIKADGQQLDLQPAEGGPIWAMFRADDTASRSHRSATSKDVRHEAEMRALEEYRQELMKNRELQRKAEQISKEFLW